MAVWMVRAGRQAIYAPFSLEQSLVGIGWHELGDLSDIQTRDQLADRMRETYPERSPAQISSSVGQVWILVGRIQRGDVVNELLDMYDRLPDGLQAELPLKCIWALVPEE